MRRAAMGMAVLKPVAWLPARCRRCTDGRACASASRSSAPAPAKSAPRLQHKPSMGLPACRRNAPMQGGFSTSTGDTGASKTAPALGQGYAVAGRCVHDPHAQRPRGALRPAELHSDDAPPRQFLAIHRTGTLLHKANCCSKSTACEIR